MTRLNIRYFLLNKGLFLIPFVFFTIYLRKNIDLRN
jgi:hypothetical protein